MIGSSNGRRKKVSFEFVAGADANVYVAGTFNHWDPKATPLMRRKGAAGTYHRTLMLSQGTYEYRFVVNDQWQTDPKNPQVRPNGIGSVNNVISV